MSWNTANNAVLAEGQRLLIADPARFDGVTVIGVDEHVWRHTRRGDKYVTVIIDLTPIRDGTGPGAAARHDRRTLQTRLPTLAGRPAETNGVTEWKSLPWTGFPGSRPPPPKSCPTR